MLVDVLAVVAAVTVLRVGSMSDMPTAGTGAGAASCACTSGVVGVLAAPLCLYGELRPAMSLYDVTIGAALLAVDVISAADDETRDSGTSLLGDRTRAASAATAAVVLAEGSVARVAAALTFACIGGSARLGAMPSVAAFGGGDVGRAVRNTESAVAVVDVDDGVVDVFTTSTAAAGVVVVVAIVLVCTSGAVGDVGALGDGTNALTCGGRRAGGGVYDTASCDCEIDVRSMQNAKKQRTVPSVVWAASARLTSSTAPSLHCSQAHHQSSS